MAPGQIALERNERLSSAAFLSILLDKIRNILYVFLLAESLSLGADQGRGRRSRGCLTTCRTTTTA
jgi:hypothetical protein